MTVVIKIQANLNILHAQKYAPLCSESCTNPILCRPCGSSNKEIKYEQAITSAFPMLVVLCDAKWCFGGYGGVKKLQSEQ